MTSLIRKLLAALVPDEGVIIKKLLLAAGKPVLADLFNSEYQKKALEFVRELDARDDLSGLEKAKEFNARFLRFLKAGGKAISSSVLNCLRETALAALQAEG